MKVSCLCFLLCSMLTSMSADIEPMLSEISELAELTQRKIACLVGAIVGDGASSPVQWVYDQQVSETTKSFMKCLMF